MKFKIGFKPCIVLLLVGLTLFRCYKQKVTITYKRTNNRCYKILLRLCQKILLNLCWKILLYIFQESCCIFVRIVLPFRHFSRVVLKRGGMVYYSNWMHAVHSCLGEVQLFQEEKWSRFSETDKDDLEERMNSTGEDAWRPFFGGRGANLPCVFFL